MIKKKEWNDRGRLMGDKEEKNLNIEKAKVLEGILRTLFFVLVADTGGLNWKL